MNDTQILEYILGLFQEGDWNDRSNTLSFDAMFDRRLYVVHYRVKTLESAGILRTERIANERRCRVVRGFSVNERV